MESKSFLAPFHDCLGFNDEDLYAQSIIQVSKSQRRYALLRAKPNQPLTGSLITVQIFFFRAGGAAEISRRWMGFEN
jgi:hypothetical protein